MMIKHIINCIRIIILLCSITPVVAQAQNTWIKSYGSSQFDYLDKLGTDVDGNVYLAGRIRAGMQVEDTLISKIGSGSYNYVMIKLNAQGNKLWVVNFYQSSAAIDEVSGLTTDRQGNVYLSLTKPGVLFKYTKNGVKVFEKTFQAGNARLGNIVIDDSNFVWVCGSFSQYNFSLDGLPAMPHHGGTSFYIAKLDSNGNAKKVIPIGCNSLSARVAKIALKDSMVYLTANFLYDVFIKTDTFYNIKSITVAFTTNGDYVWAKPIRMVGATGSSAILSMTVMHSGEIAIGGVFYEPVTVSGTVLSNGSNRENFYLALYKPNGDLLWAKQSNTIYSASYEMRTTDENKLALIFDYNFAFAFGGKSVGDGISNKRYTGMMCVNADGTTEWMRTLGQSDWTYTRGLAIDENGNWYVGGYFQSTTTNIIDGTPLTAVGEADWYIIKNFFLPQPSTGNSIFCSNESSQILTATGNQIKWYSDSLMNNLLYDGNNYSVTIDSTLIVYVTQSLGGAVSSPKRVNAVRHNLKVVRLIQTGDTLTVTPTIGTQYRWYRNNSLLANAQSYTHTATQSGSYHTVVIDSNTCSNYTDTLSVLVTSLHQLNTDLIAATVIYPSPANSFIRIESPYVFNRMRIRNFSGQLVDEEIGLIPTYKTTSHLPNGMYFVELEYSNGMIEHHKLMIQH